MIPTTQEVTQSWNNFAKAYAKTLERPNLHLGLSLSRMLKINSAKNILEVGCGSGYLTVDLLQVLPAGTKYTSIDISEEMIKLATERKKAFENKLNDNIDHSFIVADAENLSFIPDESVDVYLSSLCLHLTPDPEKALKEAMRVLKKGGRIGFSVLGKYEQCNYFNLFADRLKEFDVEVPQARSMYRYGDRETLIKLAEDHGIEVDFCWKESVAVEIFEEEDVECVISLPSFSKIFSKLDEETCGKILEKMKKEFLEKKKNFIPIQNENVLLVGRKPNV